MASLTCHVVDVAKQVRLERIVRLQPVSLFISLNEVSDYQDRTGDAAVEPERGAHRSQVTTSSPDRSKRPERDTRFPEKCPCNEGRAYSDGSTNDEEVQRDLLRPNA